MSIAGFKKQMNKANQLFSEKVTGAKGTELDDDFIEMEKKIDAMEKLLHELTAKTHELLQPNPVSRSKMAATRSIGKIKGTTNTPLYPQPEGNLGEVMIKYGRELGNDSLFGQALVESGESFRQLADIKYTLEDSVKQNFIEPLQQLESKELKEVNHHRKKLSGRRLDYDFKKRKHTKDRSSVGDDELRSAEEKFEESRQITETAMINLLENNDTEQMSQLISFIESQLNYFKNSTEIIESLMSSLKQKSRDAMSRPKREPSSKRPTSQYSPEFGASSRKGQSSDGWVDLNQNDSFSSNSQASKISIKPSAEALFDFEPESEGELGFKAGDIIQMISRIDENWLEGTFAGKTGYFPVSYVRVNGNV